MEREQIFQSSVIQDMSEGVMAIRFDGVIELTNESALSILEKRKDDLEGRSLARAFFDDDGNDDFIQCVLDAVYEKGRHRENYVPYRAARGTRQLRVVSSCLHDHGEMIGVILVISDITELTEMRDAVRAMETIQNLNRQLELRNRVLQETFGRYLSDDVVREILASPEGWKLGGQRKALTVLMSDLRGFTALSERMAAQDLIVMLNHYFGEMYEEIEHYGGTLIEFMGDGMLVVFGAPIWRENHAADAVAAAIAMQKRMEKVNRWNEAHGFEPLGMGIGINTDEMILGNIGSEKRTKYGVLGPAVNLAGRIEGYTTAGQVLLSPGTRAAVTEALEIRNTLTVSPKGTAGELTLYDVTGIGGSYQLQLSGTSVPTRALPHPVQVLFSVVEEKQIDLECIQGTLTALSDSGAILKTEESLPLYANLCLEIGDRLYAKITGAEASGYRLTFTAKPPCFAKWARGLLQSPANSDDGGNCHATR